VPKEEVALPTYQYACTECGHRFEQFQSFSEDALTTCPECSGRLRKVFNAVGVVFKGSGFYRTDSRKGAETKSQESKPAAKSDTKSESSSTTTTSSSSNSSSSSGSSSSKEGSAA
jgi:putative FmdB family regulatory protein